MATLLPLIKKVVLVTILVMVALIGLSSMGINITPLLAGAGVVGLAVGFGAQALVRDIVSGVFFLIDDAFRVGEYIEMGDIRGTVESMFFIHAVVCFTRFGGNPRRTSSPPPPSTFWLVAISAMAIAVGIVTA